MKIFFDSPLFHVPLLVPEKKVQEIYSYCVHNKGMVKRDMFVPFVIDNGGYGFLAEEWNHID